MATVMTSSEDSAVEPNDSEKLERPVHAEVAKSTFPLRKESHLIQADSPRTVLHSNVRSQVEQNRHGNHSIPQARHLIEEISGQPASPSSDDQNKLLYASRSCTVCNEKFEGKRKNVASNLRRHMRTTHPDHNNGTVSRSRTSSPESVIGPGESAGRKGKQTDISYQEIETHLPPLARNLNISASAPASPRNRDYRGRKDLQLIETLQHSPKQIGLTRPLTSSALLPRPKALEPPITSPLPTSTSFHPETRVLPPLPSLPLHPQSTLPRSQPERQVLPSINFTTPALKRKYEKPFKCDVPGCAREHKGFLTVNDLDRHRKSVHHVLRTTSDSRSFVCAGLNCNKVGKVWPRLDNFRSHLSRMHPSQNIDSLVEKYALAEIVGESY